MGHLDSIAELPQSASCFAPRRRHREGRSSVEFDIVLVGDPRFEGGTGTAMASEAKALSDAGYKIGFLPVESALLRRPRPMHPGLQGLISTGAVHLIAPLARVKARLCILHHPQLFETYPVLPIDLVADETVLVVHHPPKDGAGRPYYDAAAINRIVTDLFGPTSWAPVGPKVRAAFAGMPGAPSLTPDDWVNVLDDQALALARDGFLGGLPVIGRHSRPDPQKWPATREAFLAAYPADPDIRVRLLGYGPELDAVVGARPANWDVLPFNALSVRQFLGSIDFFVYFHGPRWIEAFGYAVIEAMASGAVAILPPDFAPLFGEAAICCPVGEVADRVRALHRDVAAYRRQSAAGQALVRDLFGPARAVHRVAERIGPPARPLGPAQPASRPTILYLTSNGVGMGHLTRALASARRLEPRAEPVVITMSKGFSVAAQDGIQAEYIPYHRSVGMDREAWASPLATELAEIIGFHRPDVFVFDGNLPYEGLIAALENFPALWKVWQRRGMWVPDSGAKHIAQEPAFDVVIEPAELAAPFDRGLTMTHRSRTLEVPPVLYLRPAEALDRATARAEIGLDPDGVCIVLQLGSGNNLDLTDLRRLLHDHLPRTDAAGRPVQLVVAEWMVGNDAAPLPEGVIRLRSFPFSRMLAAFDAAVAMAGYNTFHENIRAGLPTLFLANENPQQDEQWRRAEYGALRGLCLSGRVGRPYALLAELDRLMQADTRQAIRDRCAALPDENGADAVADYLVHLAYQRKTRRD